MAADSPGFPTGFARRPAPDPSAGPARRPRRAAGRPNRPSPRRRPARSIPRDPPEPDEKRKKLVADGRPRSKKPRTKWEKIFKKMVKDQKFCAGAQWPEETKIAAFNDDFNDLYVANITLRHVKQRVAAVYAKNPKVIAKIRPRILSTVWDGTIQGLHPGPADHPDAAGARWMPARSSGWALGLGLPPAQAGLGGALGARRGSSPASRGSSRRPGGSLATLTGKPEFDWQPRPPGRLLALQERQIRHRRHDGRCSRRSRPAADHPAASRSAAGRAQQAQAVIAGRQERQDAVRHAQAHRPDAGDPVHVRDLAAAAELQVADEDDRAGAPATSGVGWVQARLPADHGRRSRTRLPHWRHSQTQLRVRAARQRRSRRRQAAIGQSGGRADAPGHPVARPDARRSSCARARVLTGPSRPRSSPTRTASRCATSSAASWVAEEYCLTPDEIQIDLQGRRRLATSPATTGTTPAPITSAMRPAVRNTDHAGIGAGQGLRAWCGRSSTRRRPGLCRLRRLSRFPARAGRAGILHRSFLAVVPGRLQRDRRRGLAAERRVARPADAARDQSLAAGSARASFRQPAEDRLRRGRSFGGRHRGAQEPAGPTR